MLHPGSRSLYTDALTPPLGYAFDQAIGATYALDPTTLLTVPIHLGLALRKRGAGTDPIDLFGALRRIADRTTVYTQCGRIQAPNTGQVLFSLLETMIVEVTSPGGGAFHPKVWVLRFKDLEEGEPLLRLLILTRNLTVDRSWDLCLQLEGHLTKKVRTENQPIAGFIRDLPSLANSAVDDGKRDQAEQLATEVARVEWELPEDFDEVRFHAIRGEPWLPVKSDRLAVVSPFVTIPALEALAGTTTRAEALVSRMEEFDALDSDPRSIFGRVAVLDDATEPDDSGNVSGRDMLGLHAKVFMTEKGDRTRVYVGSANATTAALIGGQNVEIIAELIGNWSGGIDALLGEEGIGKYIEDWVPSGESPTDSVEKEVEKVLDRVREALARAKLRAGCVEDVGRGRWRLELRGDMAIDLDGIGALRAWPITVSDEHASDIFGSMTSRVISIGAYSPQSITGLIAFEVASSVVEKKTRFTLNLPLEGLPEERSGAILRTVLSNHDGFLRYLLLLLGEFDGDPGRGYGGAGLGSSGRWSIGDGDLLPLLEEMARAFSRDPDRLHEIRGIVEQLDSDADSTEIIPKDFRDIWKTFEQALDGERK